MTEQKDDPSPWITRIHSLLGILNRLTFWRLAMAAVAFGIGIVGVYGWEHRDDVVPALAASPVALMTIGVTVVVIAIALIGDAVLVRTDRKGEALEAHLRGQVAYLTKRADEADAERHEMAKLLEATIKKLDETAINEARCQRRLQRAEDALQKAGMLPLPREPWGDTS